MAVAPNATPAPDAVPVRRALISVFDKTGLVDLARALAARGVEILSTGGSARALSEAGLAVTDVSAATNFPEIMDGRVKTLHPAVHGGLLAIRNDPAHAAAMREHGIEGIDLLVVNLYPFEEVLASGAEPAAIVENIDIGGPAMTRAGAKNHAYVCVLTDPADYAEFVGALDASGGSTDLALRRRMAAKAFGRTASYDAAVSGWFAASLGEAFPQRATLTGTLAQSLRYGENPHQTAAFYRTAEARPGVSTARQLQGKALSFNNINDTDAAYECVAEFDPADAPAVVIVKHANPCGASVGPSLLDAYNKALACDPVSAFGGIVAVNRRLDRAAAEAIAGIFTEVVIAPDADEDAVAVFARKPNLRLLLAGALPDPRAPGTTLRTVAGGFLLQNRDNGRVEAGDLAVATKRSPTQREMADLLFAFRLAKHVKSNAIVYARDGASVGVGAGQMSRVDSSRIAARKAEDAAKVAGGEPLTKGSVVASDAFFPFADGLLAAVAAGATAVIQPGGSMRDAEVIRAADEAGIAMVLTGMRHFRH